MIQFISQKTVTFMCRYYKVDNTDMLDVYQYGIEITLSSLLNISLVFIISLLLGDFLEGIVFLVCFIPLRSYCGGYHASTYFICNIVFAMTFIGVCFISKMLFDCLTENNLAIYEVIMLLSFLPILKYSPVKNIHKKLDRINAKKCRIISFAVYLFMMSYLFRFTVTYTLARFRDHISIINLLKMLLPDFLCMIYTAEKLLIG